LIVRDLAMERGFVGGRFFRRARRRGYTAGGTPAATTESPNGAIGRGGVTGGGFHKSFIGIMAWLSKIAR